MNVAAITSNLNDFIKRHKTQFNALVNRETALLEIGALTMASEHYRLAGYTVTPQNTKEGMFVAKLTSRGYPFNFSWFSCSKKAEKCEIHSNLPVNGFHADGAVYVVDVAVVRAGSVPLAKGKKKWIALENDKLISFVEAKKLIIYPMLLAQFIGIVHEILPFALSGKKSVGSSKGHFPPALISLGYLKGTSAKILKGFKKRKYRIAVVHNFDAHLSEMKRGIAQASPFKMKSHLT